MSTSHRSRGGGGEAVSKLHDYVAAGDIPQCKAWGKEPVDYAKCLFTSTLLPPQRDQPGFTRPARKSDPRSEIAAAIQCYMCA